MYLKYKAYLYPAMLHPCCRLTCEPVVVPLAGRRAVDQAEARNDERGGCDTMSEYSRLCRTLVYSGLELITVCRSFVCAVYSIIVQNCTSVQQSCSRPVDVSPEYLLGLGLELVCSLSNNSAL